MSAWPARGASAAQGNPDPVGSRERHSRQTRANGEQFPGVHLAGSTRESSMCPPGSRLKASAPHIYPARAREREQCSDRSRERAEFLVVLDVRGANSSTLHYLTRQKNSWVSSGSGSFPSE